MMFMFRELAMLLRQYRLLLRSLEVPCLDFVLRITCVAFLCVTILLIYLPLKRSLRSTSRRGIADTSSFRRPLLFEDSTIFHPTELQLNFTPTSLWHNESYLPPENFDTNSENKLTIVTAYFDIGTFQKGPGGPLLTPRLYKKWLTIFAQIKNPVVAYFDNEESAALMRVVRAKRPKTRIVVVDRKTLWNFRIMEPRIAKIFSQKNYPRNPPNTVVSNYSAAMHAKYELMRWTIRDNPFQSPYICWLDVGLFRDLVTESISSSMDDDKSFQLDVPRNLNRSAIGYTLVFKESPQRLKSAKYIVIQNKVWVCGCFFIGRVDVMWHWTSEYLTAVEWMAAEKWMSTDQQLIYWLFLGEGRTKLRPRTTLQLYHPPDKNTYNNWFYLGYLAKEAGGYG